MLPCVQPNLTLSWDTHTCMQTFSLDAFDMKILGWTPGMGSIRLSDMDSTQIFPAEKLEPDVSFPRHSLRKSAFLMNHRQEVIKYQANDCGI